MKRFELRPREGVGDLRFGMTPREIRERLPERELYEGWMGGNLNDSLLFHGAILGFDRCDSMRPLPDASLVDVHVRLREDASFADRSLSHWTRETLEAYFASEGVPLQHDRAGGITVLELGLWFTFGSDGKVEEAGVYQTTS